MSYLGIMNRRSEETTPRLRRFSTGGKEAPVYVELLEGVVVAAWCVSLSLVPVGQRDMFREIDEEALRSHGIHHFGLRFSQLLNQDLGSPEERLEAALNIVAGWKEGITMRAWTREQKARKKALCPWYARCTPYTFS